MQITLDLPEDIAQHLSAQWRDLPRAAMESLVAEAYRADLLTAEQVRRLLGYSTRMRVATCTGDATGRHRRLEHGNLATRVSSSLPLSLGCLHALARTLHSGRGSLACLPISC